MAQSTLHPGGVPINIPLQSVSVDFEARAKLLFPEAPELQRAVAIYNYRTEDGNGFQFDLDDEISVREYYVPDFHNGWFGVHLKTGTWGVFPASHVRDITRKPKDPPPPPTSESERIQSLNDEFHDQYGEEADPAATFKTISRLKNIDSDEFWLSFSMAYPQTATSSFELRNMLILINKILFTSRFSRTFQLTKFSAEASGWSFSEHNFYADYYGQWSRWEDAKVFLHDAIPRALVAWETFRTELDKINEPISFLDGMRERLDTLLSLLVSQLEPMEKRVLQQVELDAKETREHEKILAAREQDIKRGIVKANSFSSGTDLGKSGGKLKDRWRRKKQPKDFNDISSSTSRDETPLHRRIRDRYGEFFFETSEKMRRVLQKTGDTPVVLKAVIVLSIGSAATTGLATWECSPPDTIPTIDSNFWSTVASAIMGIAGLYCTIIPILLRQPIKVQRKRSFYSFLWISFLTAVAAVAVYPYQTRASLVLLFLSGTAQLATTLLLILGAVTKISEDVVRIREQDSEIADLRRRAR